MTKRISAQTRGPRKPSQTGGGLITSIRARASRVTGLANLEVASNVPLYETISPTRRHYGRPTLLSERQKHERGYDNADLQFGGRMSPYPAPSKKLPFETIAFIARHMYEGKPLKT